MAILGGSPLGLIGITSNPLGGSSTFNGGKSRNVNVASYNNSKELSLFTGRRKLRAWPDIKAYDGSYRVGKGDKDLESFTADFDTKGLADVDYAKLRETGGKEGDKYTRRVLHNNDVYDTSVLNIIEKLAPTKAALRPSDFAYLKNLGVYPNNRLMIVRRFASPTDDNIMVSRKSNEIPSLANVISWVTNEADFVSLSFGEKWDEASADFTNFLDSLGKDFNRKASGMGLGGLANAGAGLLPLPGFTEIFQRKFLENIGLYEVGSSAGLPAGNPNLIKEAKARTTVGYGQAGSGLSCQISFTFVAEYELKFISGIDPTIVWMDIIGNIVRFGTSESSNYGLSKEYAAKLKKWTNNPGKLLDEMILSIKTTIINVKEDVQKAINKAYDKATYGAKADYWDAKKAEKAKKDKDKQDKAGDNLNAENEAALKVKQSSEKLLDKLINIGSDIIRGTILKYRTEVMGIVNALTGLPSTPWHITVGNPMRPVFCSGDMLTQDVKLSFGPQLAFNDLPSSIKVEFTLVNARNLGLQEIMSKFNSGYLRTVDIQKTYFELETNGESMGGFAYEQAAAEQKDASNPNNNVGGGNTNTASQAAGSTKVSGGQQTNATVVKDPKKPQG